MLLDISLNGPFSYSVLPLIIVLILFVITMIVFLCFNIRFEKKEKPIVVIAKDINSIKKKYLEELDGLSGNINVLSKKKVYNILSLIIRRFVLEATNVDVLKYSLSEIRELNIEPLTLLVSEYYEPEFNKESDADPITSINKTKEVISKWK